MDAIPAPGREVLKTPVLNTVAAHRIPKMESRRVVDYLSYLFSSGKNTQWDRMVAS